MLKMLRLTDEFELLVAEDGEKASTIPIVFVAGEDPVTLGLMTSLARSSGNLTGIQRPSQALRAFGRGRAKTIRINGPE